MKLANLNLTTPIKFLTYSLFFYFVFFIFYDLSWGSPYFFHPDERNIASAVSQLNIQTNMNPHFFAYGSLPIYLVYFIGIAQNFFLNNFYINYDVDFTQAIILLRFTSAILTIGCAYLTYRLASLVLKSNHSLLALLLFFTSTAYFQFSHFGTFEVWISFFLLLLTFCYINFFDTKKLIYHILGSVIFGILCTLKISSVIYIIIPLFGIILHSKNTNILKFFTHSARNLFIFFYFSLVSYFITSPFNLLDLNSFINSMKYEGGVASGALNVFYTGEFFNQIPFVFQFEKIFPFLINPFLTALSIPAIIYSFFVLLKNKSVSLGFILLSLVVSLISGSILFAKWTRYVIPAVPFMYILIAIFIDFILRKTNKTISFMIIFLLAFTGILFSFSYIKTAHLDQDTRLAAKNFALQFIPPDSNILSEVYDLGITPFNERYYNITLFNFYDLDNGLSKQDLILAMENTDYIILPSPRIYKTRIVNPQKFPVANKFYSNLFKEQELKKIYETPCDIFCKITYFGDPIFRVELTTNVFDRPTLYIFKKI